MNILVLSDAFWPDHTGGISKSLLPEVEELVARGHRVVVITRRLRGNLPFHESRNGYELFRYLSPPKGTVFYRLYPLFSISQVPKLAARLHREFRFDVAYIANNPFQAVGLMRSSLGIPYVYVFYAPTPQEIELDASCRKYGLSTPLVKIVNHWIKPKEQQALSQAMKILVRSKFSRKVMEQFYGEVGKNKTVRIPLCVDTQRFSFVENPISIREKLRLPLDRPILLTVRRLVARMGLENLITAMREVARYVPNVLLLIGGKGYLENSLRKQAKELRLEQNVRFLGFISEDKLPMYYQAADLFVLPTMALEGFGLVTIEALSCGTPVVATPVGANPEVLGPLGEEFLCQDTSPEALAERIRWSIKQGVGAELRKRCREYCELKFSIERVVNLIEAVLLRALK
ncbi:MAG: glycosyltransferase family 4 protein [Syntrophothermus sp.]|uniref:glycosyltransferase family 4 protein n=1 Tax=Syntrophothermus sp. TaxID=2736299 RepID=UPI00257FACF9|nr:glycosyltransferase family 4 protein [Syntrophothermus sp.]NSW84034.1 glycosyltransferase family 4 protein [Syntrophothermus sp.]